MFGGLKSLYKSISEGCRLCLVWTVEKVEADLRVRLIDRATYASASSFHLTGRGLRAAKMPRRATIWSATASERRSAAVCSAATVA